MATPYFYVLTTAVVAAAACAVDAEIGASKQKCSTVRGYLRG